MAKRRKPAVRAHSRCKGPEAGACFKGKPAGRKLAPEKDRSWAWRGCRKVVVPILESAN